ncbi:hypothetical protein FSP39_000833 [Pinctada imbricata]|uniref:C2H2-type domain-containing protein n=1 Tax=Pinctada imbricata TaxID=66713 RepID=A0AA88XGQ9_PINIB|nr:hypothetical protein FSP39_000833 [Pinctada imbricata]
MFVTDAGPSAGIACELCGTGFTRRKTLLDHYRHRHGVIANSGHSKKKDHKKNKLPKKLLDDPSERISTRSVGRKRKQETYTGSEGNGHDVNTCKKKKEIRLEQNACQSEVTIPSSSNGEAKKYACPKEDSCSVSNGAVCIGEEGAIGDSEGATDIGSGGTTGIIGGCDIAVRADATGVGSEDTISVSHGAISTKENKNFCRKNISQANPNDTEGHTEALYEQNSSIISQSKVSDVQGDSQRSDHQGNSQGSDHQGDSQRSDHQGNSQGSDHQGDSQGSEHQRNSQGSDHQGDSQRSDHQGDSQNSDSAEKVENISDSEEVCNSNNENIPETSILNSFSESPLQASSNLYDPYIDVITKKVKGTSFEYAKDVYECKECRFSCQCSLEIKKHIHSSHPNLKIQQSVQEQDVTASSQSVVTNQEKSPANS